MKHAPAETRRILRDRFTRYLPVTQHRHAALSGPAPVADELMLELLLNLDVAFASETFRARATYEEALPVSGDEPSFDDVIAAGWLRIVWGRIATPFEIDQRARTTPGNKLTALDALLKKRFEETFSFGKPVRENADLLPLVDEIERGAKKPEAIGCQTPDWIAARLWDRAPNHGEALRRWVDRWRIVGWPNLVLHRVWNEEAATTFREAAFGELESESGLTGWDDTRAGFISQISLRTDQPPAVAGQHVPLLPTSLLDRCLWLTAVRLEGLIAGAMAAYQDLAFVIRLLLTDIEEQEFAAGPHPEFRRLIDLALDRPEVLVVALFKFQHAPALLADLALCPETTAVACWLIAEWPGPSGAWDRELRARDDKTTQTMAFGDAVALLGDFLAKGSVAPAEVASLLGFLYRTSKPAFGDEAAAGGAIGVRSP